MAAEAIGPPMSEDKGRCHVCISILAGVGHKLKKNQMYRVKICVEYARSIGVKIILLQHVKLRTSEKVKAKIYILM